MNSPVSPASLAGIKLNLPKQRGAYYDGKWHEPKNGRYVDTPNPATSAISGPQALAIRTAAAPLAPSRISVAAASPLRPVRRTLVAPILPDPTLRISPSPAARVRIKSLD